MDWHNFQLKCAKVCKLSRQVTGIVDVPRRLQPGGELELESSFAKQGRLPWHIVIALFT